MQPGEGSCLPRGEAGAARVAPAAIHPLWHKALAGGAVTKCLLSKALRGAQGRAAAGHAGHHGAARGAPCRAHGVPQNLRETRTTSEHHPHNLLHVVAPRRGLAVGAGVWAGQGVQR